MIGDPQVAQPVAAHDVGVGGVTSALEEGRLARKLQAEGCTPPAAAAVISIVNTVCSAFTAPAVSVAMMAPYSSAAVLWMQQFDGDGADALQLPTHNARKAAYGRGSANPDKRNAGVMSA